MDKLLNSNITVNKQTEFIYLLFLEHFSGISYFMSSNLVMIGDIF